ncbi:sigma-54 interaction domain-containing protein [Selenihalanaerobacter shriftii]|nr:sigma-54-dependent Fis family transcriptional regulator [Selenihalanaerobacter shriftii]
MLQLILINNGKDTEILVDKLNSLNEVNVLRIVSKPNDLKDKSINVKEVDIIFSMIKVKEIEKKFNISIDNIEVVGPKVMELIISLIDKEEDLLKKYKYSQKELETILDSTHDAMIAINQEKRITLINSAAIELLGEGVEYINKSIKEVVPNTKLDKVLKTGEKDLNQLQSIGDKTIITNRVPVKDELGGVVAAAAVFRDITEVQKLAAELTNLKEIRGMLEAIINSTQDAISVVDQEGKGILINPAYTRITGLTEEDIIGNPATVDIAEGQSMHMQVLETKEPVSGIHMKVGPKSKDVIVNVSPIMVNGTLKGSVGVIHDVSEIRKLNEELSEAKRMIRNLKAKYTFEDIIANTPQMLSAINQAKKVAATPATVILRGESGTGKELFAHAIHNASKRRNEEFVRVNCPAIADSLLESELFGYEEGAFTGAKKGGKIGLFEEADGGTIFLDEIGKLSFNLQAKLLRVLQEKEITRVGGTEPIDIDVRVIVATNSNLEQAVEEGTFRKDLYYRLNVVPIFIPSLRQRKEDISKLVDSLLRKFNQEYGRTIKDISFKALDKLVEYDWPGNVRELENVIGRAMINVGLDNDLIKAEHLPQLQNKNQKDNQLEVENINSKEVDLEDKTLKEIINKAEKKAIINALKKTKGNRTKAAKKLDISVRSLYYKLDKFNLK